MPSPIYQCISTFLQTDWLLGLDAQMVSDQFIKNVQDLQAIIQADRLPIIVIAESDPAQFLAHFFAAVSLECPVFLANPAWQEAEWQQVWTQVQPDVLCGTLPPNSPAQPSHVSLTGPSAKPGWIMIPTGGSSGQIRFAIHTWHTLMASVNGFRQFFHATPVNAYCVLPLYHVSGLMQALRCLVSGGTLAIAPFKQLEQSADLLFNPAQFFLSLVPTQLQRLMQSPAHCHLLAKFRTVLLGGSPAWPDLLETARSHHIPLAPTYGMTETASQIVTLKPDQFLKGHSSVGHVLPHATLSILEPLSQENEDHDHALQPSALEIQCASLALGYYPDQFFVSGVYHPDDLGFLDEHGELHIVGRSSDTIISGGENISSIEVEAAILATGLVADVAIVGMSDRHWGEVVTALYIPIQSDIDSTVIEQQLITRLSRYKHPKQWISVTTLPRNAQGKLNRKVIRDVAIAHWQAKHREG